MAVILESASLKRANLHSGGRVSIKRPNRIIVEQCMSSVLLLTTFIPLCKFARELTLMSISQIPVFNEGS